MKKDIALNELSSYEQELKGILSRFSKDSSGLYIKRDDAPRYRQITIMMVLATLQGLLPTEVLKRYKG